MQEKLIPNHHHDHPGFSGLRGLMLGLTFAVGRGGMAQLAAELADLRPGDHVVDVGCGPGNAARLAARRGATAVGVDPAAVMLRLGRLLARGSRVTYRSGTAESLPVAADSATVVWSLQTVHHWSDVNAGLSEVYRVLRPGGRFVAIETDTHEGASGLASHGWTEAQAERFAAICADHRFEAIRMERRNADGRPRIAVIAERR